MDAQWRMSENQVTQTFNTNPDIASIQPVRYSHSYELCVSQAIAIVAANHTGARFDGFKLCLGAEQDQLQGHSEFGGDEGSSADAGFHFAEFR